MNDRGDATILHLTGGLLWSVIMAVAPVSILSQGVQDSVGEVGVYLSVILGAIGIFRYIVTPLQTLLRRSERIPHIEKRLEVVEDGLGVTPSHEDR